MKKATSPPEQGEPFEDLGPVDYDKTLKPVVKEFFEEMVTLVYPVLAVLIDWGCPPEFLEQEFLKLIKAYFGEAKYCDILAKVRLKTGEEKFLLLHWELEGSPDSDFGKRMFDYFLHIRMKYDRDDIAAIAFYVGPKSIHQVGHYFKGLAEDSVEYKFRAFKVWEQDEAVLFASENPAALIILAIKKVIETYGHLEDRAAFKEVLFNLAFGKTLSVRKLEWMLIFVEQFMLLPKTLEQDFKFKIFESQEKEEDMEARKLDANTRDVFNAVYHRIFGIDPVKDLRKAKAAAQKAQKDLDKMLAAVAAAKTAEEAVEAALIEAAAANTVEAAHAAAANVAAALAAAELAKATIAARVKAAARTEKRETKNIKLQAQKYYRYGMSIEDIAENLVLEQSLVEQYVAEIEKN